MRFKLTARGSRGRLWVARLLPLALLGSLALGVPAAGAAETVTAGSAVTRPCHRALASNAAGRDAFRVTAPSRGLVSVGLSSAGDWDVAVFGPKRRLVAGSAGFAGNELAEGFVRKGERLTVQACRFRGDAATAKASVRFTAIAKEKAAARSRWST